MEYLKSRVLKQLSQKGADEEEAAIETLSNRLQHATLAADRRSAVLGLKSFSRQFRESVVGHGLRPLLLALDKDSDNRAMVKAILETLIILFLRGDKTEDEANGWISSQSRFQNGKYPSPLLMSDMEADQFSMWIADEVTSSDAHLQALINILQESLDYHIRLYTLQLFEFLVCTRPTRTKEALLNIPLAIPAIVSLLNDVNDPVRNEAILVLMALVNNNFNIQKLVAFENTFDRLFEIIEEEGGIRGSILVQDCLTLLTNLLMYNASNQKYFLETEGVPKLAKLLAEPIEESIEEDMYDESGNPIFAPPIIWTEQRLQNMSIALEICKSFVDEDDPEIHQNQDKLFQAGIFFCTMRLVFSPLTENPIRKTALQITGDIIAGNSNLQLKFSQVDVPYLDPSMPTQLQKFEKPIPAPVALLNWALLSNSVHIFEIRLAAAYCLRCFFKNNNESKIAFLTDQAKASQNPNYYEDLAQEQPATDNEERTGNGSENPNKVTLKAITTKDESTIKTPFANIFSTLMDLDFENKLNPYRVWFAATILVYLFEECPENRNLARELNVGNAEEGEEVMTSIQAIAGILTTTLDDQDPRIATGLMILLTTWLYEDFGAVNDFLSDPSIIKSILAFLSKNSTESSELVHGMGSILVGIAYEFSQKSSPLPRTEMHSLVTKALGANNYALKVKQFKDCEEFREFSDPLSTEVERDSTGLPKVFFIPNYVDLIKDNYYRIRKALSHNPLVEPHIKISYELLEDLETKNAELVTSLQELKELTDHREKNLKTQITKAQEELEQIQNLLEKSNAEIDQLKESEVELTDKIETISNELKQVEIERSNFQKSSEQYSAELNKLSKQNYSNEGSLNLIKQKLHDTEAAKAKAEDGINKMSRELFQLTRQKKELEAKISKMEKEMSQVKSYNDKTIKDYESQLTSIRATNDELRAKIKILEQQLRDISRERDNGLLKLRELLGRLTDAEAGNEHLMEKLRSAAAVVQDLRNSNSEQGQQLESLKVELFNKTKEALNYQSLQIELNSLRDRNQALEAVINSMKESIGQDNEVTQKNLLEALENKSTHEIKVKSLMLEIETLKRSLEVEKESLQHSQNSYQVAIQQLELKDNKILQVTSDLKELALKVDSLKADLQRLSDAERFLQQQVHVKEEEISSIQDELRQTVESASTLQGALEGQLASLNERVSNLNSASFQAKEEYDKLKEEYDDLQSRFEQLQDVDDNPNSKKKSTGKGDTVAYDESELMGAGAGVLELKKELLKKNEQILEADSRIKTLEGELELASHEAAKVSAAFEQQQIESANSQEILLSKLKNLERFKEKPVGDLDELKGAQADELLALHEKLNEQLEKRTQFHSDNQEGNPTIHDEVLKKQEEELQRLSAEHDDLTREYEKAKTTLEQLEKQTSIYENEKAHAEQKISELTETVDTLKEELSTAEEEKTKLVVKVEKIESELKKQAQTANGSIVLSNGPSDNDSIKDTLTKEVANKISELMTKDQLITEITKKLESSTIALEDLTERNDYLESEMKEMNKIVKDTEKVKDQLEKKVKQLEKDMDDAIVLNDNLNLQLDDKTQELKQTVLEFEADRVNHKEEISAHLGVEKELTKQIESLKRELKKRITDHEKERKLFSGGADQVLQENSEKIKELESLIQTLKASHETRVKEIQDFHELEFAEIEKAKASLISRCEELTNQLNVQDATRAEFDEIKSDYEKTVDHLQKGLNETREHLQFKEEELNALRSQLTEKTEEFEKVNVEVFEKEAELVSLRNAAASADLNEELQSIKQAYSTKCLELAQLEVNFDSLKEEVQGLKLRLTDHEKRLEESSKHISELEGTIASLKFEKEKLEDELQSTHLALERKSFEVLELQSRLKADLAEVQNSEIHQTKLEELKLEILETQQKLSATENENKALLGEISNSRENFKKSSEKWKSDQSALRKEISKINGDYEKTRSELRSLLASKDNLEKENANLNIRLENNSSSKQQLEAELKAVSNDLKLKALSDSETTKRIAQLQSKAKESDELVFDLKTKLCNYVDENISLEAELNKSRNELQQLQEQVNALKIEKQELDLELESKETSIQELHRFEQENNSNIEQTNDQINQLKKELEQQADLLAQTAKRLESEATQNTEAAAEVNKLTEELRALQSEYQRERESWEEKCKGSNSQRLKLEENLNESHSKLQISEEKVTELIEEVSHLKHKLADMEARSPATTLAEDKKEDGDQKLKGEIKLLMKQLAAKKKLEADFEDLVLLWEDQEQKVIKYKSQLKALNQTVSSDEDEDDDEDVDYEVE